MKVKSKSSGKKTNIHRDSASSKHPEDVDRGTSNAAKSSASIPRQRTSDAANRPRQNIKLTQVAYEKILNAIIYGWLDLGEPLSENDLAKALGLSKAPIRESLGELRLKGLVVVVPQSGSYVFSPTAEQIEELCDFRSLLETRALRASMIRSPKALVAELRVVVKQMKDAYRDRNVFETKCLDTKFHNTIIRHSGNRFLIQSYENIGFTIDALRHRFMDTAIFRNKAFDEHLKIITLLESNQVTKATDILQRHIARTKHLQTGITWTTGRLRRKDYKFRDYSTIFA
jgi:DNA-binding GntR family transcriptional regulator